MKFGEKFGAEGAEFLGDFHFREKCASGNCSLAQAVFEIGEMLIFLQKWPIWEYFGHF